MRNDQQQMYEGSAFSKIGSFISSMFKGAHATDRAQGKRAVVQQSSMPSMVTVDVPRMHVVCVRDKAEKRLNRERTIDRFIAETPLSPDKFKPSPRFFTNWSQYKLIHTLYVRGEVSRRELGELIDIANIPDLVARMNRLGWSISCERKGMVDVSGRCRYRGCYSIAESHHERARSSLYLVQRGYV